MCEGVPVPKVRVNLVIVLAYVYTQLYVHSFINTCALLLPLEYEYL